MGKMGSARYFRRWRTPSWRSIRSAMRPIIPIWRRRNSRLRKLLIVGEDEAYCQPCDSPIWDTALAVHALFESAGDEAGSAIARANTWLSGRQVLEVVGDWAARRPNLRPGGWAFQYWNDYYPDVDDTAVVAMALDREDAARHRVALERAAEWIIGMQSRNGGWGAFDADNTHYYLNQHPVRRSRRAARSADRRRDGALRRLSLTGRVFEGASGRRARTRLFCGARSNPTARGSGAGEPTTSTAPGRCSTHSFPTGENAQNSQTIRRAVDYLLGFQQPDGGWGEDGATYWRERRGLCKESTASQTAWAVLGLMAAGEAAHPAVAGGIRFLSSARTPKACGTKTGTRRSVFRACSICGTTAIALFSRSWRWRAIAT